MRSRLTSIGISLFMLAALLLFALYFAVPKAVLLTLPNRWNAIPTGQKISSVHQYLGTPATKNRNNEQWLAERENGEYILTIFYNKDTIASSYNIVFNYRIAFIKKQYHLKP